MRIDCITVRSSAQMIRPQRQSGRSALRRQRPVGVPVFPLDAAPPDKLSKVLSFVQLASSKMLAISLPNREWRAGEDETGHSYVIVIPDVL